jgi:2'-5' RNA ligase
LWCMSGSPIRSFVALDVFSPEIVRNVRALQREISEAGLVGKAVEPESLHITLQFLGEVDPALLEAVKTSLSEVRVRPMRLVIRGVGYFPGGSRINIVWLGVEDADSTLSELQREVASRLSRLGFQPDKEFKPHITILRVKSVTNKTSALATLRNLASYYVGEIVVNAMKLKKSTLTPQGPIYEDLKVYEATP